MSDLDREQTATVLDHLCDNADDETLRMAVRQVAHALRGNGSGFVILAPGLIAKTETDYQIRSAWQSPEFAQAVMDVVKAHKP